MTTGISPSLRTVSRTLLFYSRVLLRVLVLRPAMLLGVAGMVLFILFMVRPQEWQSYVLDEAERYQKAPPGYVLTERCTGGPNELSQDIRVCEENVVVTTDDYAEEGLRAMKSRVWLLLLVSVLTEGFQVAAGSRRLFPARW